MEEKDLPLEPCTLGSCVGQVVLCGGMQCLHDLRLCLQVRVGGAAHALKQLSFKASRMHLANVCEIALTAGDDGRTQLLDVLYDELLREQWASMSQKVKSFNIEEQVLASSGLARCVHGICLFLVWKAQVVNDVALKKAMALHDKLIGAGKGNANQVSRSECNVSIFV